MKATERTFKALVRERRALVREWRDLMRCPSLTLSKLMQDIREELVVLDSQANMMEPDDDMVRMAMVQIAALVLEADIEWFRD